MQQTPKEHRIVYSFTADSSYDAGLSTLFITLVKFPFHFKRSKCCLYIQDLRDSGTDLKATGSGKLFMK
jgi:hypothetical protein